MASRIFAVDLGAWSVKLAIASPGIRGALLLDVVERLVPPPEFEGEAVDVRARRVLADLVREMKLGHDSGYLGVYGDQVFTQVLDFGFKSLRRAELDKAVGGELEGVVPVDLEDMVYTYAELPAPVAAANPGPAFAPEPTATGMTATGMTAIHATGVAGAGRGRVAAPAEGMRVLTYAMRRDRAEELIAIGKEAGFEVRGVLACGGAAVKLVNHVPSLARARAEGSVAVIDIGHDRTDVVIVANGKAVFSRSVARAGKQVTEAIQKYWKLPWEDAERAKHSDGFVASQAEPATSESWARIHGVLIAELQPFARDLRQTLAACRAKTGFTPSAVLIVGGGARLRGMASFLTEQLGVPAWRLSAEDMIAVAGPKLGLNPAGVPAVIDSAALTIGMAYDAAGGRPMFDLRSGSLAVKMDLSFVRSKAVPLGAAVLAIAAFAAVSAYADLYRLRKAEKTLTARIATESAEVFQGKSKTAEEILEMTTPGGTGRPRSSPMPKLTAYDLLLEISSKVPAKEKISLDIDHLDIADQKVEMSGTVKTPEQVDDLVTALKEIKCFKKDGITRGPLEAEGELKKFRLTISSQCM
ncbi:MAG: pilus assembly protein PilM [Deltaproteobacteria bacterium]|nr:pilus assembly protein PilM [Deltaproteobacteria bacterium]